MLSSRRLIEEIRKILNMNNLCKADAMPIPLKYLKKIRGYVAGTSKWLVL